jgi:hypothetical protein
MGFGGPGKVQGAISACPSWGVAPEASHQGKMPGVCGVGRGEAPSRGVWGSKVPVVGVSPLPGQP